MISDTLRNALLRHGSEKIAYAAGLTEVNPDDYQGPLAGMLVKAADDLSRRMAARQINSETRYLGAAALAHYRTLP